MLNRCTAPMKAGCKLSWIYIFADGNKSMNLNPAEMLGYTCTRQCEVMHTLKLMYVVHELPV